MVTRSEWSPNFFSGTIVDMQRRMYSDQQTQAEADFLEGILTPKPGAGIADVPCGTGRLALALAARGYALTGMDSGVDVLADARRAAAERGLTATFEQRDMRDLPWAGAFDHAFSCGNSFGYFDDTGNRAFLQAVCRILKPGGTFILETALSAEGVLRLPLHQRWFEFDDMLVLHETRYDPATATLTSQYVAIRDGKTERKQAVYQVYLYRQLVAMMEEAGFTVVKSYGSPQREPFQLGSPGLWLVGRRST